MGMLYKNLWGSPESGIDQQRSDMFRVSVTLPRQLVDASGVNVWDKEIGWAVEKFPFPSRDVARIAIKHGQQTNYQIGADTALESVSMTVRYAFNQRTAVILERLRWLTSNPRTGGHGLSSKIKTNGFFYWLVPNEAILGNEAASERDSFKAIRAYELHGCWLSDLQPTEADQTKENDVVAYTAKLSVDRYYPVSPSDLQNLTIPNFAQ